MRLGDGLLYRADLSAVAAVPTAPQFVDLRIDLVDVAGNTSTYEVPSAFSVSSQTHARRRSAGR
jgi:hypothetical protein